MTALPSVLVRRQHVARLNRALYDAGEALEAAKLEASRATREHSITFSDGTAVNATAADDRLADARNRFEIARQAVISAERGIR